MIFSQILILRCYATLSDLIFDLTGLYVPLPIFSFGFFVALAFLIAAWFMRRDIIRKEKLGYFQPFTKEVWIGKPASPLELGGNALIGFIIGYKLLPIITNYQAFSKMPQEFILSSEGSVIGGLVVAIFLLYLKYYEKNKVKLDKPKKEKVKVFPHELTGDIVIMAAFSGIAGAKIFNFFEAPGNLMDFINDPLGNFFSGLAIYGGIIGGAIGVSYYAWKKNIHPLILADTIAPTLFIAYAVGRMGCQVSGDGDWGIVNTAPKPDWLVWLPDWLWAYDYPHNIINQGTTIPGCMETYCKVLEQPVYPTPLYEGIMATILFVFLWNIRKKITIPGVMISLYLALNGVERFFIEKIRVNTKLEIFGFQATQAEFIAVVFILLGIAGIFYFRKKYKNYKPGKPAIE
ncbi:MAG: prolipoprotein diacylglyceryl transferase family protein [Chitinophagales bacterium]